MKKAGYPQESLFYWGISKFETDKPEISLWRNQRDFENNISNNNFGIWSHGNVEIGDYKEVYSAPLATELLEVLSIEFEKGESKYFLTINRGVKELDYWAVYFGNKAGEQLFAPIREKDLCTALAKMVLYLVKEGLLLFN